MQLILYDKNGREKARFSPSDSSTQTKEIQGDNVLGLSFTLYEFVAIDVNDYIDYEGERYRALEKYAPSEKSTVEWEYSVQFYGVESLIKRFLVLNTTDGDNEAVFTLTDKPSVHLALIVRCINEGMASMGTARWVAGAIANDLNAENVVIDYHGKYCDEALRELAEAVGSEWYIDGTTVSIGRCEFGEPLTLGYGEGKGLTSLDRDRADNAKFYTRLFPIGSSRNIDPSDYNGHTRLQLPGGAKYVDVNTDEYGIIHHYEQEAFAGIYPRRIGEVASVRTVQATGDDGKPYTIYYFKDNGLDFNPDEYMMAGKVLRVSFQDGEMAGLGESDDHYFEVNWHNDTREFEIITIWPYGNDIQLPGGNLIPKRGDHYILWNCRMPREYYGYAEAEFLAAVNAYNADHALDVSRYKGPTDHVWAEQKEAEAAAQGTGPVFYLGRRVRLESSEYFPDNGHRQSRITKITRKVTLPSQMDLEISNALSRTSLEKIGDDIGEARNYAATLFRGIAAPDLIRVGDGTKPTDNNLYSARRSHEEFLSRKSDDAAQGVISFRQGAEFGQSNNLYGIIKESFTRVVNGVQRTLSGGWAWFRNLLADVVQVSGHLKGDGDGADSELTILGNVSGMNGSGAKMWTLDKNGVAHLAGAVAEYLVSQGYGGDDIVGGSGWKLEKDAQGRGHLFTDFLTVRLKALFASLEVRKVTYSSGVLTVSGAGSESQRVVPIGKSGDKIASAAPSVPEGKVLFTRYSNDGETFTPAAYKALEYIEKTANAGYLDTGYIPNSNTKIVAKVMFPSGNTATSTLWCSRTNTNYTQAQPSFSMWWIVSNQTRMDWRDHRYNGALIKLDEIITVTAEGGFLTYPKANGEEVTIGAANTDEWQLAYPITLWATKNGTATTLTNHGRGRIYRFAIYEGDTLVQDWIPAQRTSDNKIGLFDLVSGDFIFHNSLQSGGNEVSPSDVPSHPLFQTGTSQGSYIGYHIGDEGETPVASDFVWYSADTSAAVYAYRVYCTADDGTTATMNDWHVGDQAKCQTFNIKPGKYDNVENRYWWRLVLREGIETLEDGLDYAYIDIASNVMREISGGLSKAEYPIYADLFDAWETLNQGTLSQQVFFGYDELSGNLACDLPAVGDTMAQQGSQVDESRMGFALIKAEGTNSGFYIYSGVNYYTLTGKQTMKAAPSGVEVSAQSFMIYSAADAGEAKPVTIYRGEWYVGARSTYYDVWTHNGETWICKASGIITTEPRDGDANWEKMVEKGADGESGVGLGENLIDRSEAASIFNVSDLSEDTLGNDYIRYGLTDKTYVVANLPADGTIVSGRARIRLTNCTFKANVNNSNTDEHGRYGLVQVYIEAKNGSQGTAWPEICQAKVYEDGVLELNHERFALDANGGTFDGKVWLSLRNFASGTVSVERVKLEVGEKCSAWSLSENDKKGASGTSRWMVVEPSNVRVYLDDDKLPRLSNNITNTANSPAIKITLYEQTNGVTNKVKDGSHFFVDGNVNYNIDGEQDFADPVFSMDEAVYEGDGDYFEWDSTNECWRTPVGKTFVKDMPFQWLKFYWRDGNNIYAEQSILLNVDGANGADGNAFTLSPSEFVVTQRYGENVSGWDVANNSVVASGFYRSGNNASEAAAMAIQSVAPSTAAGVLKVSQTQTNKLLIDTTALGNIDNGINYITATIRLSKGSLYQDLTFNLYINRLGTLYSQTIGDATETIRQRSGWKYNPTTQEWEELALVSYVEESAEGFSRQISSLPIQKNLLLNTEFSALSGGGVRAMHVTSVGGGLWLQHTESRKMLPHNNYFMLSFFGRGSGSLVCSYEVYKEGRTSAVRSGSTTLTLSSSTQRQYVRFNTNTTGTLVDEDGYTFIIKFSTTGGGEFYLSRPQLEVIGSATRPTTWSNGSPNILLNSAFSEIENDAPKYWEYKGSPSARELSIEVPPYWNDWMLWDTTTCPDVLSVVDGVLRLNPTAQYQGITQYSNVGSAGRWEKVLKHGGTYTVSFKAKGADSTNMASFILHVLKIGDDGQPIAVPAGQGRSQIGANFPIEETWKSYSFTFTISPTGIWNLTEEQTDLAGYGFFFMIGCAHGTQVSSEVLDIKEVQLEAGSTATNWQPASYDAVYRASRIEQTEEKFEFTVQEGKEVGGMLITKDGVRLKGAQTTIEGDLDLQGLTTENVKIVERNLILPTVINMGIGATDGQVVKSVQVGVGEYSDDDTYRSDFHQILLPFYDSGFLHWGSAFSPGTASFKTDVPENSPLYGSFNIAPADFAEGWQTRIVQWRKNGTRLTISNEHNYRHANWKDIETWQNWGNDAYGGTHRRLVYDLLRHAVVVCSDARILSHWNVESNHPYTASHAEGDKSTTGMAGTMSCNGYNARFLILLPGQTLQLRSQIVRIGTEREVLTWVVENPSEFVPISFRMDLYKIDNDGGYVDPVVNGELRSRQGAVYYPISGTSGVTEIMLGPGIVNKVVSEVPTGYVPGTTKPFYDDWVCNLEIEINT